MGKHVVAEVGGEACAADGVVTHVARVHRVARVGRGAGGGRGQRVAQYQSADVAAERGIRCAVAAARRVRDVGERRRGDAQGGARVGDAVVGVAQCALGDGVRSAGDVLARNAGQGAAQGVGVEQGSGADGVGQCRVGCAVNLAQCVGGHAQGGRVDGEHATKVRDAGVVTCASATENLRTRCHGNWISPDIGRSRCTCTCQSDAADVVTVA